MEEDVRGEDAEERVRRKWDFGSGAPYREHLDPQTSAEIRENPPNLNTPDLLWSPRSRSSPAL